jgi:small multidrug resistance pump
VGRTSLLLALGIVLDVAGATCLKLSHGLTHPMPSALMFACYAASLSILAVTFRDIDLSVAYTIWSVTGITLVASVGIIAFGEPATLARLFWMTVILAGVVGLRWASAGAS